MSSPSAKSPYVGYRFPPEVISHAVWLYFRFPLSLRMVEEMLAARGIIVSHESVRQWALKFGQAFANQIRRRLPRTGDKWHLDEVVILSANSEVLDLFTVPVSSADLWERYKSADIGVALWTARRVAGSKTSCKASS